MRPLRKGHSTLKGLGTHRLRTGTVAVSRFQILFGNYMEGFVNLQQIKLLYPKYMRTKQDKK